MVKQRDVVRSSSEVSAFHRHEAEDDMGFWQLLHLRPIEVDSGATQPTGRTQALGQFRQPTIPANDTARWRGFKPHLVRWLAGPIPLGSQTLSGPRNHFGRGGADASESIVAHTFSAPQFLNQSIDERKSTDFSRSRQISDLSRSPVLGEPPVYLVS